jgi:hypothetical protein
LGQSITSKKFAVKPILRQNGGLAQRLKKGAKNAPQQLQASIIKEK